MTHVDAATKRRAFGDGHRRCDEISLNLSLRADLDLGAGGYVALNLAEHNNILREDLGFDRSLLTDDDRVLLRLDRAFHLTLNRQVFLAP